MGSGTGDGSGSRRVRVSQLQETPAQIIKQPDYAMRYAYARSSESRRFDSSGQDYITIISERGGTAFALCDGVGQSFHGELAASTLGEKLAEWLWQNCARFSGNERALQNELSTYLENLTAEATKLVDNYDTQPGKVVIDSSTRSIYQDALNESRSNGSETTFSGGYVALPSRKFPQGLVVLTWMGDSPVRLWGNSGERSAEIAAQFRTGEHWSTRYGLDGRKPHVFIDDLQNVNRILVASDGLTAVQSQLGQKLTADFLNKMMNKVGRSGNSDDLSVVELALERQDIRVVARPAITDIWSTPREINVRWSEVAEVDSYEVTAIVDAAPAASQKKITGTDWRWQGPQAWENCEVQLRARKGDDVSEASVVKLHQEMELVSIPVKHLTAKLGLLLILIFLIIILSFIAGRSFGEDGDAAENLFSPEAVPTVPEVPTVPPVPTPPVTPAETGAVPPSMSFGAPAPVISASAIFLVGQLAEIDLDYHAGGQITKGAS